jgi:hypothetical protein
LGTGTTVEWNWLSPQVAEGSQGAHGFAREMEMVILEWGLGLFLGALLLHLLLWRLHKPKSPIKALLALFGGVIGAGLAALYFGDTAFRSAGLAGLANPVAYVHILLFFTSMACAYIVFYTVLEWDSPTLTLVMMIGRAGKSGFAEAEFIKHAEQIPFLESRMQDLRRSGILVEKNGRYVLSPGPHWFYRSIVFYNRLLGADTRSG